MVDINPEKLMSYVDDELDAKEQAEVEELIEREPEVRAMVAQFRESAELLKDGFDEILDLPVPQQLIDSVQNHQAKSNIIQLRKQRWGKDNFSLSGLVLAASVALCVGMFAGVALFGGLNFQPSRPDYSSLLQDSLEMKPRGVRTTSEDGWETVIPIMTFLVADGRICREYERIFREQRILGVACRGNRGKWVPMVEVDRTLLATNTAEEFDYSPASGDDDPISMVLLELGAKKGMTAQEERLLREKGWQ